MLTITDETNNFKIATSEYGVCDFYIGNAGFKTLPERRAYISWLIVKPENQGKGYGRKLYGEIESYLSSIGITSIELNAIEEKIGFWKKMGFVITRRVEGTAPTMLKILKSD